MQQHRRMHTQEKPFYCTLCKQNFSIKSNSYSHGKNLHNTRINPITKEIMQDENGKIIFKVVEDDFASYSSTSLLKSNAEELQLSESADDSNMKELKKSIEFLKKFDKFINDQCKILNFIQQDLQND
ncbi:hypothetical protein HDU92_008186, partial [Lobulomyces angularis]